jgi:hypothetical protein
MKILCYSPYLAWQIHAAWESAMLMALQTDGVEVQYLLCDGLYPLCDMDTALHPRTEFKCNGCQATQAQFMSTVPLHYQWLGRFLTETDRREISAWVIGLQKASAAALASAEFEGLPLAAWIRGSIHLMFRIEHLDPGHPEMRKVFIAYLAADALATRALRRALDEQRPDLFFFINGMRASTRVALAVARERGVRVITHERGWLKGRVQLVENDHSVEPDQLGKVWAAWRNVPLTADQIKLVASEIKGIADGSTVSWHRFSPLAGQATKLHQTLQLDPAKPIWSAFTSSMDEYSGDPCFDVPAISQDDWLTATVAFAARHPEIQVVIRQHPNRPLEGPYRPFIEALSPGEIAFQDRLVANLPANVRFLPAKTEISSYDLIEATTLGLTYISSLTIEMAARGLPVVMAGTGLFRGLDFVQAVQDPAGLEAAYQGALRLPPGGRNPDIARQAHRFAYAWFHRWLLDLPMVEMPNYYTGKFAFKSVGELVRGKSPDLDRLRRIVLDGEAIIPRPTGAQLDLSEADEIAHFALPGAPAATAAPAASRPSPP